MAHPTAARVSAAYLITWQLPTIIVIVIAIMLLGILRNISY